MYSSFFIRHSGVGKKRYNSIHHGRFLDNKPDSFILVHRMKTGYPVPDGEADASLTIKNSRFIGHAGKTETTGDAKAYINRIKERYPGATHVVYAYCIGFGASLVHGMSDAGEPSGTAGRPVLEVLKGSAIGDITLAVVRFFGGTKLGTGGLVRAYTDTAKATLAALSVKTKHKLIGIELSSPYEYVDRLKTIMDYNHAIIKEKNFSERAVFRILIPEENRKGFLDDVLNASGARIAYRLL